jgi:DNA primase
MDVKVVSLPEGVDPADMISKNGVDTWREAVKNSKHIIEFLLDKILQDFPDDARKAGKEIREKVLPYVDALPSSIEKMHFLKKISDVSVIPLQALEEDLRRIEQEYTYEKKEIIEAEQALGKMYRKDYILRKLSGIILWQKTLPEPSLQVEKLAQELAELLKINPETFLAQLAKNKEDLIFEAEVFYGAGADLKKDTEEMLFNLREELLKEELEAKMRELHLAEAAKDAIKSAQILKEIQDLNNKLQEIKNGRLLKKNNI